jgi:hypothetical protein
MASTNRSALARVLSMVGLADISDKVIEALTAGNVTDATIGTDTHLEWMALKRRGTPDVLRNVRWVGRSSFDAFQVTIDHAGYTYTLVVPKVCGNLSLVSKGRHSGDENRGVHSAHHHRHRRRQRRNHRRAGASRPHHPAPIPVVSRRRRPRGALQLGRDRIPRGQSDRERRLRGV